MAIRSLLSGLTALVAALAANPVAAAPAVTPLSPRDYSVNVGFPYGQEKIRVCDKLVGSGARELTQSPCRAFAGCQPGELAETAFCAGFSRRVLTAPPCRVAGLCLVSYLPRRCERDSQSHIPLLATQNLGSTATSLTTSTDRSSTNTPSARTRWVPSSPESDCRSLTTRCR